MLKKIIGSLVILTIAGLLCSETVWGEEVSSKTEYEAARDFFEELRTEADKCIALGCGAASLCSEDSVGELKCECIDGYVKDGNGFCVPDGCVGVTCGTNSTCVGYSAIQNNNNSERIPFGFDLCECDYGFVRVRYGNEEKCVLDRDFDETRLVVLNQEECDYTGICDIRLELEQPYESLGENTISSFTFSISESTFGIGNNIFSGNLEDCLDGGICKNINAQYVDFQLIFHESGKRDIDVELHDNNEYWQAREIVTNTSAETGCYGLRCSSGLCEDVDGSGRCPQNYEFLREIGEGRSEPEQTRSGGSLPNAEIHYKFDENVGGYTYACSPKYDINDVVRFCGETSNYTILAKNILYPIYRDTIKTVSVTSSAKTLENVYFSIYFTHPSLNNIQVILQSPQGNSITFPNASTALGDLVNGVEISNFAGENPIGNWKIIVRNSSNQTGTVHSAGFIFVSNTWVVHDDSGNNRHATYNGSGLGATGKIDHAIKFSGSRDTVKARYKIPENFTVSFWMNRNNANQNDRTLFIARNGSNYIRAFIAQDSGASNRLKVQINGVDATSFFWLDTYWNHIILSFRKSGANTIVTAYRNGKKHSVERTINAVANTDNSAYWTLGVNTSANNHVPTGSYFTGYIDDFRIYNKVLNRCERDEIYSFGCTNGRRNDYISNAMNCFGSSESYCGDGMVTGSETCDMGQQSSSEGCSSSCALQSGYYWYDSCTENFEGTPAANCTTPGHINWRNPASWEFLYQAPNGTVSWDSTKEALKITGQNHIMFKKMIPIDTALSYYLEYDIMTENNSNKSMYSGVISYDEDFNQLSGHPGLYDYFNDSNDKFDAGVWYYRKNAKINGNPRTGESSNVNDRDKWHTGTRYARVLLMANYNQTNSQVTYIKNLKFYPGAGVECSQQSRAVSCNSLPSNASWNSVSKILQSYTGSSWTPSSTGSYNTTPSTTECRFKCNSGYVWNGSACINERQQACSGLPSNASWNTASSIHQTWNGSVWLPSDEGVYNATPSTTECRFVCNSGYVWNAATETCDDVDECEEETYDCPDYSMCVNESGSYTCDCISGYEPDFLTQSCVPVCGDGKWTANEECDSELDFTKNCRDLDSDYKSSSYASCGSSCTWDESTCEHVCTGTTCGLVWSATAGGIDTVINCLADGTCGSGITCSSTGSLPEVECVCPEGFHLEMPGSDTTVYVDSTSPVHPLSTPHEVCVSNVRKVQCPASDMPQYSEWSDQVNNGIATLTWDENNKNYGVLQQDNSFISLEEACEWSCSEGYTEETSIGLHFTHADFWLSWDAQKERPLYERMEAYFNRLSTMGNAPAGSVWRIVYDALDSDIQARLQQNYDCDDDSPLYTVCEDMTWRIMSSLTRLVNRNIPLITYNSSTATFSASDAASVLTDETRQLIKDLPSNIIVLPGRIHNGTALVNRRIIEDAMNRMAVSTVRKGYPAGKRMCVNRRIDDCTKDSVGFLDFKLVDKNNKTYIMPESYYYKYSENLVQPVVSTYINGEWIVPQCPWSCKPGAQRSVASSTHCEPAAQLNIPDNNLKKCANRAIAAMNSNENLTFLQWIKEVCAKENDISLLNGVCTVVNGIYDLESLINAILPAQYEFVLVTPPAEDDPVYMADAQLLKSMDCSYATLNNGDFSGINSLSTYITNLEGIQYFISLETLSLDGQAVSMLDPLGAMTSTGFIEEPIALMLGTVDGNTPPYLDGKITQISNGATVNIRKFEIIPDVEGECGEGYSQVFDTIVEQYGFNGQKWNQKTDGETLYSDAAVYKPNSYVPQYRRTCIDEDYLADGSYTGSIDVKNCSMGSSYGIIIETISGPSHKTAMICENDGFIPYARFRETLESGQNVWPLRKIAVAEIGLVRTDRMVDKDLGRFFFSSEVDYSEQFIVPYYTARLSNAQNECGSDEWAYILTFKGDVIDASNNIKLTDNDSNTNFPAEKEVVVCADAATGELPNLLFQNSRWVAYELRLATPKIKGLKSLILSRNTHISNTWFNHIKSIEPLIHLPLLEYFSLEGSSVVDENATDHPFVQRDITPLIHNHSMKWLDLGGNLIQEDLGSDNDSLIGFTEDYFYDNPTLTTRSGSLRSLRNMTKIKSFSAPYANISYFNQRLDTVHRQCSCGDVKSYKTPKSIVIKPNGASIDLSEAEYTFDFNPEYDPGSGENMVLTPNVSFNINESLSSGTNYVYLTIEYEADNDASYTGTLKYKLNKIGSETTVTFEEAYSDFDETVSHNNTTKKALKVRVANITASYSNESPIKSISVDFTVQIGGGTECEVNMADADTDLCGCNDFTGKCDGKKWYPGTLAEQWPLLEYLNLNGNPMRNHALTIQHADSRIGNTVTTCSAAEHTNKVFVGKYDGISSFKNLKGLFLHGVKEIYSGEELLEYNVYGNNYGCDVSQDRLSNVIPQLHELEYADISGTLGVPDTSNPANNIYSEMPDFSNTKLKELDVSENLVMSEASVAKSLSNQHDMEYLNIGKIKIHGTSAGQKLASIDFVYGMQNLQYLDISGNSIDEDNFNDLPLNHFPRLEHLNISNNSVTKLGWLASTPYLRYLDISGNRTEEIEQVSYLKDLEELNIEGHCIVDQNGLADTARISAAVVPSVTVAGAAAAALNCTYTPVDPSCGNGIREGNEVCDSEYKLCRDITGYESYRGYCYCNDECNGWEHEYGDSDEDYDDYDYDEDDSDNEIPDIDSDLICKNGTAMTDSYGNPFCLCNAGYHLQGERCVRDAVQSMPYGSADTIRDEAGTIGNQNDLHFVVNWRLHNDDDELPDQDTEIPDNDIPQIAEIQALYSCSYPTMDNCFSESYQRDRCGILYRGVCRDMMDFCTFVGGKCCIPEKDGSGNLLNVCKPQSLSICQQSGGKCSRKDTLKDNSAYLGCHFNANGACGSYVSDCVQDITRISCNTDSDCGCSKGSGHCFYQCMDTGNGRHCVGIACSDSTSTFDVSQCSVVTDEDGAREICVSRYIAYQITLLGSDGNPCFGYPAEVSLEFDENNNLQEKTSCVMPSPMLKFSDECSQSFVGCLNNLQARIHNLVRFNTDKLKEASDPRLSLECGKDDISKGDAASCGAYSRDGLGSSDKFEGETETGVEKSGCQILQASELYGTQSEQIECNQIIDGQH
ncbi:leucine-rich repeat domain-containing protein [bacterium]|nr:leucine-rich repeat domain-containing protein [bacterium]